MKKIRFFIIFALLFSHMALADEVMLPKELPKIPEKKEKKLKDDKDKDKKEIQWVDLWAHLYRGIIPGVRDNISGLPHNTKNRFKAVTWVGFTYSEEKSRVFIRTTGRVKYKISQPAKTSLRLEIDDAYVYLTNNSRQIISEYFDSPVEKFNAVGIGGYKVRVEITLSRENAYTHSQDDNYIYIDFPQKRRLTVD